MHVNLSVYPQRHTLPSHLPEGAKSKVPVPSMTPERVPAGPAALSLVTPSLPPAPTSALPLRRHMSPRWAGFSAQGLQGILVPHRQVFAQRQGPGSIAQPSAKAGHVGGTAQSPRRLRGPRGQGPHPPVGQAPHFTNSAHHRPLGIATQLAHHPYRKIKTSGAGHSGQCRA